MQNIFGWGPTRALEENKLDPRCHSCDGATALEARVPQMTADDSELVFYRCLSCDYLTHQFEPKQRSHAWVGGKGKAPRRA
jgi:hypothetical protein